jgi:hypothetical protein
MMTIRKVPITHIFSPMGCSVVHNMRRLGPIAFVSMGRSNSSRNFGNTIRADALRDIASRMKRPATVDSKTLVNARMHVCLLFTVCLRSLGHGCLAQTLVWITCGHKCLQTWHYVLVKLSYICGGHFQYIHSYIHTYMVTTCGETDSLILDSRRKRPSLTRKTRLTHTILLYACRDST